MDEELAEVGDRFLAGFAFAIVAPEMQQALLKWIAKGAPEK